MSLCSHLRVPCSSNIKVNHKTLIFISLKLCFLGFVYRHNDVSSAICEVLSSNSPVLKKYFGVRPTPPVGFVYY